MMVSSKDSASVSLPTAVPPTLPPSVEEAYKKKCIELKRRLNEVQENNDLCHLRKIRMERAIRKMRLERAILLDALGKRMRKHGSDGFNGIFDDESEGSSEGPPTPEEKPLRSKRGHRRPAQSPQSSFTRYGVSSEQYLRRGHSSAYSTPIAPHPGPSAFAHVNGSAAANPIPLQPVTWLPSAALTYANPSVPGGHSLPLKPPSAKELHKRYLLSDMQKFPTSYNSVPTEGERLQLIESEWNAIHPNERGHWEYEAARLLKEWEKEMAEGSAQPAMSSQRSAGEHEEDGDEYDMEDVEDEERASGGFAAINT